VVPARSRSFELPDLDVLRANGLHIHTAHDHIQSKLIHAAYDLLEE